MFDLRGLLAEYPKRWHRLASRSEYAEMPQLDNDMYWQIGDNV